MTSEPILYAKTGGPPDDWMTLFVFCDGELVAMCVEADVRGGWAKRFARGADGKLLPPVGDELVVETVRGKIEIARGRGFGEALQ